jgi:hypothetical protein
MLAICYRRQYVLRDIQPYSCTFDACPDNLKTYHSRRVWAAHEFEMHTCVSTWHCIGDYGLQFIEREDFKTHIMQQYLRSSNPDLNIKDVLDSREQRVAYTSGRTINCPLCQEEVAEARTTFQKHVGAHISEIALKALPAGLLASESEEYLTDDRASDPKHVSERSSLSHL